MPIIKAAVKHLRQSNKRREVNRKMKDHLKSTLKEMKKLAVLKNVSEIEKRLPEVFAIIDKAAKNHLIHPNKAAHRKSAMAKLAVAK